MKGAKLNTRNLRDLKVTNPYLRLGTDVSELEKSIETLGLIAPLVISSENVILAGARRYQALLNLGRTEAPVIIMDGNELEKELISIDENLVRKDLSKIEIESHLRRAKEIYQQLFREPEIKIPKEVEEPDVEVLPAEKFLNMVSEKTGLSPKQIHEAIQRDEMASPIVKQARIQGQLSLSQTNELVKLSKNDQELVLDHVREMPVREMKKFVKIAKNEGIDKAIKQTPIKPFQKEFEEINGFLKKTLKKIDQLKLEGFEEEDYPLETQTLLQKIRKEENGLKKNPRNSPVESQYEH
jgi:ParB family chromosome partitioning protein